MSVDLERWWEEPHFKRSGTRAERAHFVLVKLMQRDPRQLTALLSEICGEAGYPEAPEAISEAQWRTILTRMGASPLDIAEVLLRIGLA